LTSVSGGSARGYLTAASGRRFAAALGRQTGAYVAAGHLARVGRLFGGLVAMNLAAAGAPVTIQPHFPLHILQLNVTDESGRPANNVDLRLVNTDSISREETSVPIVDGVGRVAVPAGDYSAFAAFADFTPPKNITALRLVTRDDFTVSATSTVTTVSIHEQSATSPVSVTTPRPAAEDLLELLLVRFDARGNGFLTGLASFGPPVPPVFVSAQPVPRVGRLHDQFQWGGVAPPAGNAYRYDVAFASHDIPADEHFTVRASQIATVHQHFSADPASPSATGQLLSGAIDPATAPFSAGFTGIVGADGETMPGDLTQYLGTADGGQWVQSVFTPNGTFLTADRRTFVGGHQYSRAWAHGPLAPGFGQHHGVPAPVLDPRTYPWNCRACTAGRTLSLVFSPVGDSELDHATEAIGPGGYHLTLYRNGARVFSGSGTPGVVVHGIARKPTTYRAVLDVSFAGVPGFSQSTRTRTDLTVPYTPVTDPHAALPPEDTCAGQTTATPCQILPALTFNCHLATDEHNTSSAPRQVMHLRVVHVAYDGQGFHAQITSAAVSVSFNGGRTWRRATLTGTSGHYTATWANPASARGSDPWIKVTARDALGGSITQTITNAYTIAAAAPNGSTR
jgi:hypothetical protein